MIRVLNNPRLLLSIALLAASAACGQKPASIRISPPKTMIYGLGKKTTVTAEVLDKKGVPVPGTRVTWDSSKPKVVSVDTNGSLVAVGSGRAVLTAKLGAFSSSSAVEVVDVATLTINPLRVTLAGRKGTTTRLEAVIKDSKGKPIPVRPKWSSSNPKVAAVSSEGVVTSVGEGRAVVNAVIGEIGSGTDVRIVQKEVASFEALPPTIILKVGDSQKINSVARDQSGTIIEDAATTYVSSDPKIALCEGSDVKGVAPGTATIQVVCSGKSAEVSVLVN